jgi:hypothetical protein
MLGAPFGSLGGSSFGSPLGPPMAAHPNAFVARRGLAAELRTNTAWRRSTAIQAASRAIPELRTPTPFKDALRTFFGVSRRRPVDVELSIMKREST